MWKSTRLNNSRLAGQILRGVQRSERVIRHILDSYEFWESLSILYMR
jgi:hypothetical protein